MFVSSALGLQAHTTTWESFIGFWNLNSGPYVFIPSTLPTEASPQHSIPLQLKLVSRKTEPQLESRILNPQTSILTAVVSECMITFTLMEYVQKPKFPKRKLVADGSLKHPRV